VAATALNKPAVQSYMPFVDLESCVAIKDMYKDSMNGTIDLDPRKYFHRFALNTSLTLNYGVRIDGGIDQELLREGMSVQDILICHETNNYGSRPCRTSGFKLPKHFQQLAGLHPFAETAFHLPAEQLGSGIPSAS